MEAMPTWLTELLPIGVLLAAIGLVIARLPKVDLGHAPELKRRRFLNWMVLGLTYAFLYMGRYNVNVITSELKGTSNADFGIIFGAGTLVYGVSFLLNGPLTDKLGGRTTILLSAAGSAIANVLMGAVTYGVVEHGFTPPFGLVGSLAILYGANMYFQSFGAVSIVKVNAHWFHVRERGVLGGVFGILISLGIYFAFDWSRFIVAALPTYWGFFVPALVLLAFVVADWFIIRDKPSDAGHADFETGDATWGVEGETLGVVEVFKRMLSSPVILVILSIEFCSGFLRNAIMQWGPKFAGQTGLKDGSFVFENWGLVLCVAGILGGTFAGVISDKVFDSRRGPVSAVLYGGMVLGSIVSIFLLESSAIGWAVAFMSLCVIGVHGMLSGTASMDFGGKKNAGVAVGIIDGAVYLGTAVQSILLGWLVPSGELAKVAANWSKWPLVMIPFAAVGFVFATRVWNAKPQARKSASPGAAAKVA